MYADTNCKCTEQYDENGHFYTFTGACIITKKEYSVKVPGEELFAYRQGALIQNAMKSVSASDREFLLSGYSPEAWNDITETLEEDYK